MINILVCKGICEKVEFIMILLRIIVFNNTFQANFKELLIKIIFQPVNFEVLSN